MSDQKSKESPLKRILLVFSMVAFLGSTGYGLFGLYSNALQQPQTTATSEEASVDQQLAAKERGYELVLEREPENRVALEVLGGDTVTDAGYSKCDRAVGEVG